MQFNFRWDEQDVGDDGDRMGMSVWDEDIQSSHILYLGTLRCIRLIGVRKTIREGGVARTVLRYCTEIQSNKFRELFDDLDEIKKLCEQRFKEELEEMADFGAAVAGIPGAPTDEENKELVPFEKPVTLDESPWDIEPKEGKPGFFGEIHLGLLSGQAAKRIHWPEGAHIKYVGGDLVNERGKRYRAEGNDFQQRDWIIIPPKKDKP